MIIKQCISSCFLLLIIITTIKKGSKATLNMQDAALRKSQQDKIKTEEMKRTDWSKNKGEKKQNKSEKNRRGTTKKDWQHSKCEWACSDSFFIQDLVYEEERKTKKRSYRQLRQTHHHCTNTLWKTASVKQKFFLAAEVDISSKIIHVNTLVCVNVDGCLYWMYQSTPPPHPHAQRHRGGGGMIDKETNSQS